jgi:uncharacterized lipoprotein YddW (UPF0748 family)
MHDHTGEHMMRALYGYRPLAGSPAAQAAQLVDWGVTAVFGGYEDLALVDALHSAGLRVYAEFNCFAGQQRWSDYPASRPVTAAGTPLEPIEGYYGANPAVPALRAQRLDALRHLLENHALDGVWLDFIRWPGRWERAAPIIPPTSFDAATIRQFQAATGLTGALTAAELLGEHAAAWHAWRCEQVRAWVEQARQIVDAVRPEAALGLFAIPWLPADFDGAVIRVMGQDVRQLAPYVDVFSPMTYHRMCDRPVHWIADTAAGMHALTQTPICPIIQSVDHPDALPADEYAEALAAALNAPDAQGAIVFTMQGVLDHAGKLRQTQRVFSG